MRKAIVGLCNGKLEIGRCDKDQRLMIIDQANVQGQKYLRLTVLGELKTKSKHSVFEEKEYETFWVDAQKEDGKKYSEKFSTSLAATKAANRLRDEGYKTFINKRKNHNTFFHISGQVHGYRDSAMQGALVEMFRHLDGKRDIEFNGADVIIPQVLYRPNVTMLMDLGDPWIDGHIHGTVGVEVQHPDTCYHYNRLNPRKLIADRSISNKLNNYDDRARAESLAMILD
jgi:hypothetical protein